MTEQPRRLTLADIPGAPVVRNTSTEVSSEVKVTPAPSFRRGSGEQAPPRASSAPLATEKQLALVTRLLGERDLTGTVYAGHTTAPASLTKSAASHAITSLLALPKRVATPVAPAPSKVRTNRYPGKCEHCGTRVEAESGTLTMSDEGKWEVAHLDGECPLSEYPFPVGRYALVTPEGVKFYVASHEGFYVQASDDLHPLAPAAARSVIAAIAEDPEAASRLYGQQIGKCGRCNRTLTDEVSRAAGLGPVCASKGW